VIEAKAIKHGSKLVVQRNRGLLPEKLSGGHCKREREREREGPAERERVREEEEW
jgi:hypothetical protein